MILSKEDLQQAINQLTDYYLPMNLDKTYHQNKVAAISKLNLILKQSSREILQELDFEQLLLCALTLVYFFKMRIELKFLKTWGLSRNRNYRKAEETLRESVAMLLPECSEPVIEITLDFFTEFSLWSFESYVELIMELLLYSDGGKMRVFNMMLADISYGFYMHNNKDSRHRLKIFYNLLWSPHWIIEEEILLPFVTHLLDFFAFTVSQDGSTSAGFKDLSKGFKACIGRIFERVENKHRILIITAMLDWFSTANLSRNHGLEFSTLLEHAANLYEVDSFSSSLKKELIHDVLVNLVGSKIALNSLMGCKLLLKFLDRHNNTKHLIFPKLFYDFTQTQLKIGQSNDEDILFLRQHREEIQLYLINAVKLHSSVIVNLKTVYALVCCVVLEVPCGLTAAAAAFLMMNIQLEALNGENIPAPCRYWMHAMVVSVLSLICWVHKAPVLYTYVQHIISRRASEAPQLNPPMRYFYKIARHHVTWNKPSLFFEDWELRYALWKHFKEPQAKSTTNKKI